MSGGSGGFSSSSNSSYQTAPSKPAQKPRESGGIRTISDVRTDTRALQEEAEGRPRARNLLQDRLRKEEWTMPLMLLRLRIHGRERLERDLKDSGFSSGEANGYIMIAELMSESSDRRRKPDSRPPIGSGSDEDDSSDDDDLPYGNRDLDSPFGARPRHSPSGPSTHATSSSSSSSLDPTSWAAQQLADATHSSGNYPSTAAFAAAASAPAPSQVPVVKREIVANSAEPTTNVNLRLHNGTTLKVQVNLTHTIQDLVDHAASHCPVPAGSVVSLMTTFPKKVLSALDQTVKEAQLQNAVVIQSISK